MTQPPRSAIAQVPPGERDEHVLERRAVRGEQAQRARCGRAAGEQRRHRRVQLRRGQRDCAVVVAHVVHAGQRAQRRARAAAATVDARTRRRARRRARRSARAACRARSACPWSMMPTRSHSAALRPCSASSAAPSAARAGSARSTSHSCRRDCGSSPVVGSSRNRRSGSPRQRARDREPLLLSAGELARPTLRASTSSSTMSSSSSTAGPSSIERAEQPQRLLDGQLVGELRLLQLDAEALPQLARVALPAPAEHLDSPSSARAALRESRSSWSCRRRSGPSSPKHSPRATSRSSPSTATTSA